MIFQKILHIAATAAWLVVGAACASTPEPSQRAVLRQLVQGHVKDGFSGVVLVAANGHIVLSDAFGEMAGRPVSKHDRFWIASTGKQFVSAAILKLVDGGRLSLDDPLSKFFPEAPSDKAATTVRQLLSHTSGFPQSYVAEDFSTREDATPTMLAEPLQGAPGEKFRYSNLNYQMAAAIVEIASGENYREFVKRELWAPARLSSTGFSTPETAGVVSAISTPLPPRLRRITWDEQGVYSSAKDLYRWNRALSGGKILSTGARAELYKPTAPISEGEAALGWFIDRSPSGATRIFTRGNEDFGANSLVYFYPDSKTLIIVLTHAGDADEDTSWSRLIHKEIDAALGL
ncbi:MAG: serine hydrolase domain-containing protein [Pseudomonadota bacterium]